MEESRSPIDEEYNIEIEDWIYIEREQTCTAWALNALDHLPLALSHSLYIQS